MSAPGSAAIAAFVARLDAAAARLDRSRAWVCSRLFGDHRTAARLEAGGDIGVRRMARADADLEALLAAPDGARGGGVTHGDVSAAPPGTLARQPNGADDGARALPCPQEFSREARS